MSRKKGLVGFLHAVFQFFKDERFKITFGSFLILFSIYMVIAFISYFFNWENDQDFTWAKVISSSEIVVNNHAGKIGAWLSALFLNKWFGLASFSIPVYLSISGIKLLGIKLLNSKKILINLAIATILFSILLSYIFPAKLTFLGSGPGGSHGYFLSQWLNSSLGTAGTAFLLIILFLSYIVFSFNNGIQFLKFKKKEKSQSEPESESEISSDSNIDIEVEKSTEETIEMDVDETPTPEVMDEAPKKDIEVSEKEVADVELTVQEPSDEETSSDTVIQDDYDPTLDLSSYKYPHLKILKDHETGNPSVSNEELISNKNKIIETLANYKIAIDKIKATIGPTVTLYEIVPAPGIRISKIKNLEDDIALSLAALGIRIIAPIPGKGTIGIEVPNQDPRIVSMKNVLSSKKPCARP